MSKAKKSQFDTLTKNRATSVVNLTVVLILALSPLQSFAAPKCDLYFGSNLISKITTPIKNLSSRLGFKSTNTVELTEQQAKDLTEFIDNDTFKRPYGVGKGTSPMFWYMWEMTSPSVKETIIQIIESSPRNMREMRGHIQKILQKNKILSEKQDSLFELIISNYGDTFLFQSANIPKTFTEWMNEGYQKYLQEIRENKISVAELKQKHELGLQYLNANNYWNTESGVNQLKIKYSGEQALVEIKGEWYKCQIDADNKTIKILVPRDMVRRAAWNPLYTEVLTKKIAEGAKPLKYYDGFIAANAYFYLSDGNHRFSIDTRPEVWIQMSYPAKTSSYRISFDAMGIRQPDIEALHKFNKGEASLADLIGIDAAKLFFFH